MLEEECMGSEEVEASLLRLIKNLISEVICFLDQCYILLLLFLILSHKCYTLELRYFCRGDAAPHP